MNSSGKTDPSEECFVKKKKRLSVSLWSNRLSIFKGQKKKELCSKNRKWIVCVASVSVQTWGVITTANGGAGPKLRRYPIGMTLILTQLLFITLEMCSLMYVRREQCFFLYWLAYNKSILVCAFHLPWSVIGTACVSCVTVAVGAAESRDDASRQRSGAKQRGRRSDVCNARQSSVFADTYVLFGGASRGLNIQDPIILLSRRLSYQDLHDPNRQWITVRKAKGNTQCAFQVKFVRKYGICSGYFSKWEMDFTYIGLSSTRGLIQHLAPTIDSTFGCVGGTRGDQWLELYFCFIDLYLYRLNTSLRPGVSLTRGTCLAWVQCVF